jgi:hypothetical protein
MCEVGKNIYGIWKQTGKEITRIKQTARNAEANNFTISRSTLSRARFSELKEVTTCLVSNLAKNVIIMDTLGGDTPLRGAAYFQT